MEGVKLGENKTYIVKIIHCWACGRPLITKCMGDSSFKLSNEYIESELKKKKWIVFKDKYFCTENCVDDCIK
jgi:hypothetical protein